MAESQQDTGLPAAFLSSTDPGMDWIQTDWKMALLRYSSLSDREQAVTDSFVHFRPEQGLDLSADQRQLREAEHGRENVTVNRGYRRTEGECIENRLEGYGGSFVVCVEYILTLLASTGTWRLSTP